MLANVNPFLVVSLCLVVASVFLIHKERSSSGRITERSQEAEKLSKDLKEIALSYEEGLYEQKKENVKLNIEKKKTRKALEDTRAENAQVSKQVEALTAEVEDLKAKGAPSEEQKKSLEEANKNLAAKDAELANLKKENEGLKAAATAKKT